MTRYSGAVHVVKQLDREHREFYNLTVSSNENYKKRFENSKKRSIFSYQFSTSPSLYTFEELPRGNTHVNICFFLSSVSLQSPMLLACFYHIFLPTPQNLYQFLEFTTTVPSCLWHCTTFIFRTNEIIFSTLSDRFWPRTESTTARHQS